MLKRSHLPISVASSVAILSATSPFMRTAHGFGDPFAMGAAILGGAAGAIGPDLDIIIPALIPKIMVWFGSRPFKNLREKKIQTGHRTYSHSLILWMGVTIVALILSFILLAPTLGSGVASCFAWGLSIGYFFHLVADMTTVTGVPLLWPFSEKKYHVYPRLLRYRTGMSIMEPITVFIFLVIFGGIIFLSYM